MSSLPVNQIICGDCREVMAGFQDGSFSAVVTDPPYGVTHHDWDCLFRQEWLDECLRVSSGPVLLVNAARPDVQRHMLQLEPICDRVIAWRQPRVTAGYGMFWTWQPIYCWRAKFGGWDTIQFACEGEYCHPTQKPEALMRWLVNLACPPGGLVLDPFLGSGTTAVACVQTGRNFVGIELDDGYCEIARRRAAEALLQPRLDFGDREKPRQEVLL